MSNSYETSNHGEPRDKLRNNAFKIRFNSAKYDLPRSFPSFLPAATFWEKHFNKRRNDTAP